MREGFGISVSLVSPTCFHSFRAGSAGELEPEDSAKPAEELSCVFLAACWLAICLLGLVVEILFSVWSCLSLTDFGGRIKDFNFKKKKVSITAQKLIQKGTSAHVSCTL